MVLVQRVVIGVAAEDVRKPEITEVLELEFVGGEMVGAGKVTVEDSVVHVSEAVEEVAVVVIEAVGAVDVGLALVALEEEVESGVTVCVLTTVTDEVVVVGESMGTTDTSVWVTVLVVLLAEAVTVTLSVVVWVSAGVDAVTVSTTVVVPCAVVGEEGDPPSMGTTE